MPSEGASQPEYQGLICRGAEECGRLLDGTPGWGGDYIALFTTSKNPLSGVHSLAEHVNWVNDPLHSYVADGTGGLCVYSPAYHDLVSVMLSLPALAGMEVHRGSPASYDQPWDAVLTACYDAGRKLPWAFAADDTHSLQRIGLSWYEALVPEIHESALKHALRTGAFYVSNGPRLRSVRVEGSVIELELAQASDVAWLRSGQYVASPRLKPGSTWDIEPAWRPAGFEASDALGENVCFRLDRDVTTARIDTSLLGAPDEIRFVRAIILGEPDETVANDVWRLPVCALTQPWKLCPDGVIENPYPTTGVWVRGMTHNHTDARPGDHEKVVAYRLAYQEKGQLGAFTTDYSYWETPYQWLPEDGTPQVESVRPDRVAQGERREITIGGVNFAPGSAVQLGPHPLTVIAQTGAAEVRAVVPDSLPAGVYDLVVTNPNRYRGTLPLGFTVQDEQVRGEWERFTVEDGLSYGRCTAVACLDDAVWVGSAHGPSRYADGQWRAWQETDPSDPQSGWNRRVTYDIKGDPQGGFWIAGFDGISYRAPDGSVKHHRVGDVAQRWGPLAFDQEGSLWAVNRRGGGLAVRRDGAWSLLSEGDALPARHPTAVACDSEGTLWVGFSGDRPLFKLVGDEWVAVPLPAELADCHYVYDLEPGLNGEMWASVTSQGAPKSGGVACFGADGDAAYLPTPGRLPCARIRDILVSSTGEVWFASDVGLARLSADRGEWETFTTVNSGLGCSIVLGVGEDAEGDIWCATARGVSRLSRPRQEM